MREKEYVNECPSCETQFVGMSPNEFREEHAPQCNALLTLLIFKGGGK